MARSRAEGHAASSSVTTSPASGSCSRLSRTSSRRWWPISAVTPAVVSSSSGSPIAAPMAAHMPSASVTVSSGTKKTRVEGGRHPLRGSQRQAGLADTAGADERHERCVRASQRVRHLLEVVIPAEERLAGRGSPAAEPERADRWEGLAGPWPFGLVHLLGMREAAEVVSTEVSGPDLRDVTQQGCSASDISTWPGLAAALSRAARVASIPIQPSSYGVGVPVCTPTPTASARSGAASIASGDGAEGLVPAGLAVHEGDGADPLGHRGRRTAEQGSRRVRQRHASAPRGRRRTGSGARRTGRAARRCPGPAPGPGPAPCAGCPGAPRSRPTRRPRSSSSRPRAPRTPRRAAVRSSSGTARRTAGGGPTRRRSRRRSGAPATPSTTPASVDA